jgi:hypothetical protein
MRTLISNPALAGILSEYGRTGSRSPGGASATSIPVVKHGLGKVKVCDCAGSVGGAMTLPAPLPAPLPASLAASLWRPGPQVGVAVTVTPPGQGP